MVKKLKKVIELAAIMGTFMGIPLKSLEDETTDSKEYDSNPIVFEMCPYNAKMMCSKKNTIYSCLDCKNFSKLPGENYNLRDILEE
jgi:hypothetical protein